MREIRFRSKRKDNGEWVYGWYGHKEATDQHFIMIERLHDAPEYGSYFVDVEVDPETVGQYTGLKDKNGKEIYEGDILTSEHYPFQDEGKYNYHGVIEWIDECAAFYMTKRLANSERRGISDGIAEPIEEGLEEFEIIGNIYEHPHLLGAESV